MENPDLVLQETGDPQGPTQSRLAECGSRQAIQARPDHPDRVVLPEVFQLICTRWHEPQIDLFAVMFKNKWPHFVSPVPEPLCLGSGCTQPVLGGSGPLCLPTSSHIGQSVGKVVGLSLQENHSHCSRVAPHALVMASPGMGPVICCLNYYYHYSAIYYYYISNFQIYYHYIVIYYFYYFLLLCIG